MSKKSKKENDSAEWKNLGFVGLILKGLNDAGKSKDRIKKKEVVKKEYW